MHHGFCKAASEWDYSSYNSIISVNKTSKIERNTIFNWFGGIEEFVEFHKKEKFIDLEI